MEYIVANVENIKFDIEIALEQQHGALPLPFPGMDSKFSRKLLEKVLKDCVCADIYFFIHPYFRMLSP